MRRKINVIRTIESKQNPALEQLKEAQNKVQLLQRINHSIHTTTDMSQQLIRRKHLIINSKRLPSERKKMLLIDCDNHIKLIGAERSRLTQLLTHLQAQPARSTLIEYAKIRKAIQSIEQAVAPKAQSARVTEITTTQLAKSFPSVPTDQPGNPTGNSGGHIEQSKTTQAILQRMATPSRPHWTPQSTASSNSHSFFNAYRLNKLLKKLPQWEKDSRKLLKSQTDALDKLENMLPRFGK